MALAAYQGQLTPGVVASRRLLSLRMYIWTEAKWENHTSTLQVKNLHILAGLRPSVPAAKGSIRIQHLLKSPYVTIFPM